MRLGIRYSDAVVWLPLSTGTDARKRSVILFASAALSFISVFRNASDVIKQAGVKINVFLPPRLQAAFPVKTSSTSPSLRCQQSRKITDVLSLLGR